MLGRLSSQTIRRTALRLPFLNRFVFICGYRTKSGVGLLSSAKASVLQAVALQKMNTLPDIENLYNIHREAVAAGKLQYIDPGTFAANCRPHYVPSSLKTIFLYFSLSVCLFAVDRNRLQGFY